VSGWGEPVSVVIPAHNEGRYLAAVLESLRATPDLARITVVDDGSQDGTAEVACWGQGRDPRVRLLRLPENRGKGGAIAAGAEASPSDLIVFLDADLVGLRPDNVRDLIAPVAEGRCSMSVGVFRGGRLCTDIPQNVTPILNGQRCLRWSSFRDIPGLACSRYGVEVAMSLYARRRGYRVIKVPLYGVTYVMKREKQPLLKGEWGNIRMYAGIFRYLLSRNGFGDGGSF
jgi:glycosyltransferase involved in cell wall biosynthesis